MIATGFAAAQTPASLAKFKDFHEACLRSKDSYFRLDQWMLRFMLDFARPLHGRVERVEGPNDWSLSTFGFEQYSIDAS